jgi:hypothetical protein
VQISPSSLATKFKEMIMRGNRQIVAWILFLLMAPLSAISEAGQYLLYFKSDTGDYIGQGQEVSLTDADVTFSATSNYKGGVSLQMTNFDSTPAVWWYADFSAPSNAPLAVGTYEQATRYPFNLDNEPGLSFSGDGRGCNTLTGRFEVREITYGTGGAISSFAVDFEQHCSGVGPALYGSIRFNSDVPVPTLIPAKITITNPLNSNSCVEAVGPDGTTVFLTGDSVQDVGQLSYKWTTSDGAEGVGKAFSLPVGLNEHALVQLTITDTTSGESATATKDVCVSDTQPPTIAILQPTDGSVVNINNLVLEVRVTDAVDQQIPTYDLFIGQTATIDLVDGYSKDKFTNPGGNGYLTSVIVKATDASGNVGSASVNVLAK